MPQCEKKKDLERMPQYEKMMDLEGMPQYEKKKDLDGMLYYEIVTFLILNFFFCKFPQKCF